jgi:hypothetical protein
LVPTDTSTRRDLSSPNDIPASMTAIFAADTENWLARPSSSGSTRSIHLPGSKSTTSHPLLCR